jgi:hypothetical protein
MALHVWPWRKNPFRSNVFPLVQDGIKNAQSHMGHPYLIDIGKSQGNLQTGSIRIFHDRIRFPTQVAGRTGHEGKDLMNRGIQDRGLKTQEF